MRPLRRCRSISWISCCLLLAHRLVLIDLPLISTHVAAVGVLLVGTRLAALISLEQMTVAIGTSARVTRIDREASAKQRHRLCRSAVVLQRAELGIGVVH